MAWASPAATATSTSTPKATDAHRPGPERLASPRRTTTDFQGARTSTASPATPWATTTGRPQPVPAANASPPLTRATTSTASSARLVRRIPMSHSGSVGDPQVEVDPPGWAACGSSGSSGPGSSSVTTAWQRPNSCSPTASATLAEVWLLVSWL